MPEFFLELFSEEIPARMQHGAASELERLIYVHFQQLTPNLVKTFFGPRRIAIKADMDGEVAASSSTERGPRANAPEQALAGFLRKHGASRDQLRQEGDFWVLEKASAEISAAGLIATALPALLWRFPWPKSMRWGGTSQFTWVRPLRRIICLLDGTVVKFALADGADDAHGLASGNQTEGHRFHAPGAFAVTSCADWQAKLREHKVLTDVAERKRVIADGVAAAASVHGVAVVEDAGLLDEVVGLVEWPVVLIGRIDGAYMDLPAEVMQVSMRVNQRYFALRNPDGSAAPYFAFAANIEARDGGTAIIAGNERVLRARFADARHFWDLDRKGRLEGLVPKLDHVTFHAKLGSQGERVRRLMALAEHIAPLVGAGPALAVRAAELCKADLLTGMVGEFPELQGVMGGYYARHDNEDAFVADAIRDHYAPKGPGDAVPTAPVSIAVALADKLDQLAGFFVFVGKPTGSGDPYALRRAALGIIRIILENRLRLRLMPLIEAAIEGFPLASRPLREDAEVVLFFLHGRLEVYARSQDAQHDVLEAVLGSPRDDDLNDDFLRVLQKTEVLGKFLAEDKSNNLLTVFRRPNKILSDEAQRDGHGPNPFYYSDRGPPDPDLFQSPEEGELVDRTVKTNVLVHTLLAGDRFEAAFHALSELRGPLDVFFKDVRVNDPRPDVRLNRLSMLAQVYQAMDRIADFSKIEG